MTTIKVTQLEKKVLEALAESMYAEYNYSDAGLEEVINITGLPSKVIRGVVSSLTKKQLVEVDYRESEGYKNKPAMHIWYLTDRTVGLVEHWVKEANLTPVELIVE